MPSDAARMIEEDSPRPKSHWVIGLLKPRLPVPLSFQLQTMASRGCSGGFFCVWRCQLGGVCLSRKSRGEAFLKAVEKAAKLS